MYVRLPYTCTCMYKRTPLFMWTFVRTYTHSYMSRMYDGMQGRPAVYTYIGMSVYMYVCMYVTANQFYLYANQFYLYVCVYVCMSACVRACRSIYMPLVSLHVSCLSLSWCLFSRTDVCRAVLLYTFVRKYVSTYSIHVSYVHPYTYTYKRIYVYV